MTGALTAASFAVVGNGWLDIVTQHQSKSIEGAADCCSVAARLDARGDSCRRVAAPLIAGRAPGVVIGHPADPRRSQPAAFARRRCGLGAVAGAQLGDR
jgi:hypothetical protein